MRKLLNLCAVVCVAWFSVAGAAEVPISGRYAGTVIDHFQLDNSGNFSPIILTEAEMKGAFGAARLSVLSQFVPDFSLQVCDAGEIPLNMIYARSVTTFKDLDQMFVVYDTGWICGTPGLAGLASYYGRVTGHVVGGTGRFEGASGGVESDFGGNDLAGPFVMECPSCDPEVPFPGFGSFTGSMSGRLTLPK